LKEIVVAVIGVVAAVVVAAVVVVFVYAAVVVVVVSAAAAAVVVVVVVIAKMLENGMIEKYLHLLRPFLAFTQEILHYRLYLSIYMPGNSTLQALP
jgi:hypothetical protein